MDLKKFYPQRNPWSHKGNFGYVLIVAGSRIYSGSPVLNALGALRAGADLTMIVSCLRAADIAASFAPDLITRPLDKDLEMKHVGKIVSLAKKFDSLVIGGGLARNEKTYKAIREIISQVDLPMVLDAEAIRAAAEEPKILENKSAILTPHAGEFKALTGEEVMPEIEDRKEKVKKWAEKLKTTILLKGHIDVISDGKEIILNETGSPLMTKGGTGDILAGICAAFLAKKFSALEAAQAAAFINGKAGEMAAEKYAEGLLASNLLEFIPEVIKKYKI